MGAVTSAPGRRGRNGISRCSRANPIPVHSRPGRHRFRDATEARASGTRRSLTPRTVKALSLWECGMSYDETPRNGLARARWNHVGARAPETWSTPMMQDLKEDNMSHVDEERSTPTSTRAPPSSGRRSKRTSRLRDVSRDLSAGQRGAASSGDAVLHPRRLLSFRQPKTALANCALAKLSAWRVSHIVLHGRPRWPARFMTC